MMLSGRPPYGGANEASIVHKIVSSDGVTFKGSAWNDVSTQAKSFIKKLLERDVSKRLSAVDALSEDWITQRAKQSFNVDLAKEALNNLG